MYSYLNEEEPNGSSLEDNATVALEGCGQV